MDDENKILKKGPHRYRKGEINNPYGRPRKKQSITELLREKINPAAAADAIIKIEMTADVESTRLKAWEIILDRTEGKPAQTISMPGMESGLAALLAAYHEHSRGGSGAIS